MSSLGKRPDGMNHLRRFKRLLYDCITTGVAGVGLIEGFEQAGCQDNPDGLMPGVGFDPMTDLVSGSIRKKNVRNYDVRTEVIESWIHVLTVSSQFHIKAFFSEDASTDALGVRAVIGQKNTGDQFFFFFGSFSFFSFLAFTRVPFAIIGAFCSGVTAASVAGSRWRNGPPDAVSTM